MKRSLLLIGTLILCYVMSAQQTLLHRRSSSLMQRNMSNGDIANLGNWFYVRSTAFGMVLPINHFGDVELNYGSCYYFANEHRFIHAPNHYFALGWSFGFQIISLGIKQQTNNLLSNNIEFSRQQLNTYGLPLEFFIRQNITSQTQGQGWFLDLGFKSIWNFYNVLVNQEKLNPAMNAGVGRRITYNSKLSYVNPFSQYASIRMGKSHLVVSAMYRLSNYFKKAEGINGGYILPDLPKLYAAIEMNIWNKKKSAKKDEDEL